MAQSPSPYVREQAVQSGLGINVNKVIKNTYMLLGMTLLFSAGTAWFSAAAGIGFINPIMSLVVSLGLLFAVNKARNSIWALPLVFAFTGFFGLTFGPILSIYLANPALTEILMTALASTAFVFFGLSAYALVTKKDFSFLRGFIFMGLMVLIGASVLGFFIDMSAFSLAISAGAVLLASALILFDTSRIINGGETNYIMATVSLYLDIYMLFMHLLNLLTALSGRD